MQRLPEALQARVDPGSLHPATRVGAVRRTGGRYLLELSSGGSAEVDALILALPPIAVAEVTEPLSQSLAGAHAEIEAASTVVVNVGYRASDLPGRLEGYGYLSPMADGRHFHGCTWSSNKWPGRAPEGFVALRLYGGRFGERELFDSDVSEILRHAAEELREVLGIDAKPVVSRVTRWAEAIPQYNLGYSSVLNRIESALNDLPGVFLAGAAYGGVGIPDCVRSGETAAEGAIAYLQEGRNTR
jgi:oxygen-dependent protoporphyrinogen oxidase